MSKPLRNRILILAVCSVVLFLLLALAPTSSATATRNSNNALNCGETAGTQMLWESLSHQFVSSVQY